MKPGPQTNRRVREIPAAEVDRLAGKAYAAGVGATIDGVASDPVLAARDNPFLPMFQAMPDRLREKTFMHLIGVLGPDGGDAALLGQLLDAVRLVEEQAKSRQKAAQGEVHTREVRREVRRDLQSSSSRRILVHRQREAVS